MHIPTTAVPATWKGVKRAFAAATTDIRSYFHEYPRLLEAFSWETCMAYLFTRIEQGHRRALYAGIVKRHLADPDLTWSSIQRWDMRRDDLRNRFVDVFDAHLPKELTKILEEAEHIRDRVVHGAQVSDADHRRGAVRALDYAHGFSSVVRDNVGFSPYDDLRGFTGRASKLSPATSRLVLRGLGMPMQ